MTRILFKNLDIGIVDKGAAIFNSPANHPFKWVSNKKENQTFGEVNGKEYLLKDLVLLTDDDDHIDQT